MNFALVGYDESAVEFAKAAMEDGAQLLAVVEQSGDGISRIFPGAQLLQNVEQLAGVAKLDFVILAGDHAGRADRLRFIQKLTPIDLVFSIPLGDKADIYHELAIHAESARIRVLPLIRDAVHPIIARFQKELGSTLGAVQWFESMHPLDLNVKGPSRFLDGWGWIRGLVGEIESVTATGSQPESPDADQVLVAVRCENGVLGNQRWIRTADASHRWTLQTQHGRVEFTASPHLEGALTVRSTVEGTTTEFHFEPISFGKIWWQNWKALQADQSRESMLPAIRQMEIAVGVVRSLKYQRTVALDREEVSEEAVFKSIMASTGCGLVWVLILLAILVAAKVPYVGYTVLPILLMFLGFQLFGLVYRKKSNAE